MHSSGRSTAATTPRSCTTGSRARARASAPSTGTSSSPLSSGTLPRVHASSRQETESTENGVTTVLPASNELRDHGHGRAGAVARRHGAGPRRLLLRRADPAAAAPERLRSVAAQPRDRGRPDGGVRRALDQRALSAQRDRQRRVGHDRVGQHAAGLGRAGAGAAVPDADLCLVER